jgi:hypothetical protein
MARVSVPETHAPIPFAIRRTARGLIYSRSLVYSGLFSVSGLLSVYSRSLVYSRSGLEITGTNTTNMMLDTKTTDTNRVITVKPCPWR